MGSIAKVQPRTLVVELCEGRFLFVLPTSRYDCRKKEPYWFFMLRARYIWKKLGIFPGGSIAPDGTWIDSPKVMESILIAGKYLESSPMVDIPEEMKETITHITRMHALEICEAFDYNLENDLCF